MKTYFRALALVVAGTAMWGSSHAATVDLGTLHAGDSGAGVAQVSGWFDDAYTFQLTESLDVFASAVELSLDGFFDIEDATFRLDLYQDNGGTYWNIDTDWVSGASSADQAVRLEVQASLGPGSYFFLVSGHGSGGFEGAYGYTYGAAAPVPEPEAWVLMIAGLGFIGRLVQRRRRVQAARG